MRDHPWGMLGPGGTGSLEARRAEAAHPFDFFYAKNSDGSYLLTLSLRSRIVAVNDLPRLRGVEVRWLATQNVLQLKLGSKDDTELFELLCRDLMFATRDAVGDQDCFSRLCVRLLKWQRLLSKGGPRALDDNAVRGLIAELLFLRDEVMSRHGPRAVAFWKGPLGFPQDFAIEGVLVEVKSHLVGSPQSIRIASPEQLWSGDASLFLRVYHLAQTENDGIDLVGLVNEIGAVLAPFADASAEFEDRLASVGYLEAPQYASLKFNIRKIDTYMVHGRFPRITPDQILPGIEDVKYAIQLAAFSPFAAEIPWSIPMTQQHD